MATDIATLGINIDTSGIQSAGQALQNLAQNAQKAQDAVNKLGRGSSSGPNSASKQYEQLARQMQVAGRNADSLTSALSQAARQILSFGDNASRANRELVSVDANLNMVGASATRTSSAFARIVNTSQISSMQRIRDMFKDTGVAINTASKQLDGLTTRMQNVARQNAFKQLQQDANLSHIQIARLQASMGDFGGAAKSVFAQVSKFKVPIAAAATAMGLFYKSTIEASMQMEKLNLAYSAVFGAKGQQQLRAIYEQASKVGLKYAETAEAAKGFFAAGQGTTLERDMQKIFNAVTNAGAALQLTTDEVNGSLLALGQMISKGKVQAEELRGQLGERLPGAFRLAAEAMGMTTAELDKFMADGKLTAEDLLPKLADALDKKYAEAAKKSAETVRGSINQLETEWFRFKERIANAGPVLMITKFITQYLKEGNEAAAQEAENARVTKELEKLGVAYDATNQKQQSFFDAATGGLGSLTSMWKGGSESIKGYSDLAISSFKLGEDMTKTMQAAQKKAKEDADKTVADARKTYNDMIKDLPATKIAAKEKEVAEGRVKIQKQLDAALKSGNKEVIAEWKKNLDTYNSAGAKAIKDLQDKADKAGKAGAGAAKQAANAQIDYKSSIDKTKESITALEQQMELDKTEDITKKKISITKQYEQALIDINKEYEKSANKKGVSQQQALELKQLKEQEALLKKNVQLRELEATETAKIVEKARGQISFYKELAKLSGNQVDTLKLQKQLIQAQADEYRKTLGISEELVQKFIEFSELQISTDPFDGMKRGLIKYSNEFQDQGKVWEDITYNFAKDFTNTTADMFDKFLETGELSLDSFKDLFKKFLKQLAYQAVMQPIMVNIMGGVSSMFGLGGGSGGVASAVAGAAMGGMGGFTGPVTNNGTVVGQMVNGVMQTAGSYGTKSLFNQVGGSIVGGIADSINGAVASMFPSMFAANSTQAVGNAAINATNAGFEALGMSGGAHLGTTTFTSALGGAGIGGMVGGIASPFVNSLLGIENNTGSQVGSMIGGGLGTVGGALLAAAPAMAAIPGIGWIGAGIAALGAIVGGALGGGLGTQPKQEPKLEVDLVGSLWKPVTDEMQMFNNGGPIAAWDPNTGAYRSAVETTHGASGAWDISRAYGNVMQQTAKVSWGIADALETMSTDMKEQYLAGLESLGEIQIHGIHRGDWINQENIQAFADWYVGEATGKMLTALNNIDLTPLTIAADGMAADTAEELATAIGSVLQFGSLGEVIEDETMKENFYKGAVDQIAHALENVSLAPLAKASDGLAIKTVDDLTTSLTDVFAVYDLGETIQNEDLKKVYQEWAEKAIVEAFKDVDLSFLRVDFDQNSFAGLQQAYAAVQAWQQVEAAIENVINPTTELTSTLTAASNEFDGWIANLRKLGWQEEAITEIEAKRGEYMRTLAFQLDADLQKFLDPIPEFDQAMQQAASRFDDWISNLQRLGYSQQEIIRLEGKRTEYLLEQARALREADLQNLTLRITALAQGSDSGAYALQSLQFQQKSELESIGNKYGTNSDIYDLTKNIQAVEMMKEQLNALVSARDAWFTKQQNAIQEQSNAIDKQINAINKEIQANNKRIQAIQKDIKLRQKEANNLQKQITALNKDIAEKEKEISERERAIEQWKDLLDDMRKFRRELWASENNLLGTRYDEAYKQFNETYDRAMAGDQEAFGELQGKATDLLALARDQLATRGDYNDAFYDVDQKLKAAQEYAAQQVYEEEKQLDQLKQQLEELEKHRDLLQGQLDAINQQIELMNTEIEKIEALNEPLQAQIEVMQEQQATLQEQSAALQEQLAAMNQQLVQDQIGNMTLGEINAGISALQQQIASQTAALVQQQQAMVKREQEAVTNQNNMQAILQAQAKYANSIAFEGKTNWTAQSTYDRIMKDGSFESWYDTYGKYQGGKNIPYNTTQARSNIVANKVVALNNSAYQGKTNWTANDFYKAIGGNTPENIDKWYKESGIKEGISTIYRTTQEVTEAGTRATVSSLTNNRQKINDNMDWNTSDINRTAKNNTYDINMTATNNTNSMNRQSVMNTTAINDQLGWGANYLNGTMTTHLTEAYDQGTSLDVLNGTQSTYWPQAISSINGVSTSINGLGASINGAMSSMQSQINSMGQTIAGMQQAAANAASAGGGGSGGSGGGSFLGKYSSESEFLAAKTAQVNSMNYDGRNNWTPSQVKQAIANAGGYQKWYNDWGRAEGFAEGGITPSNRIYITGENGPEFVTSPQQWGVLSNEASQALLDRERPSLANAPASGDMLAMMNFMNGNFAELISVVKQANAKLGKVEYNTDKSLSLFRNWEADGIGIAQEKEAA